MSDVWIIYCFSPLPWSILAWIILNVFTCITCLFVPYFIYLTWHHMKEAITILKCICTIIAIFFMTTALLISVHITSSFYCIYPFRIWLNQGLSALFFNQVGLSLLYLLFVIRLTFPFKCTSLQVSSLMSFIFFFGFVLMLVFGTLVIIIFNGPMEDWYLANQAMFAFQITNLVFTIILLGVFMKKMLSLQSADLLQNVAPILICASMSLLSSQLPSILSIIRSTKGDGEYLFVTHVMLMVVDQFVNLFSIYLQFPFGKKTFTKMCGKLSQFCGAHIVDIVNLKSVVEIQKESPSRPTSDSCVTTTNAGDKSASIPDNSPDFCSNMTETVASITISPSPTKLISQRSDTI